MKKYLINADALIEYTDDLFSNEVAKRIADALEVSLDFLVGEGTNSKFEKRTLMGVEEIEQSEDDKKKDSV